MFENSRRSRRDFREIHVELEKVWLKQALSNAVHVTVAPVLCVQVFLAVWSVEY